MLKHTCWQWLGVYPQVDLIHRHQIHPADLIDIRWTEILMRQKEGPLWDHHWPLDYQYLKHHPLVHLIHWPSWATGCPIRFCCKIWTWVRQVWVCSIQMVHLAIVIVCGPVGVHFKGRHWCYRSYRWLEWQIKLCLIVVDKRMWLTLARGKCNL